jgi:glyoxylase-like metal-dependent hydrolase (beta-lactamase superfamily II)
MVPPMSMTHGKMIRRAGRGLLLVALALALFVRPDRAQAGAPMAKGQAPGWYRMTLGDFEVTALIDGTLALPADQILTGTTPAKVKQALDREHLPNQVETSVNAYLINTGSKLVLIDAGTSNLFGPTLGKLVANLKASGYKPEQVDEIYITHMHPDHAGGLSAGGKALFPKAIVRAAKVEGDYWLNQANMDKAAKPEKDMFQGIMASLQPYVSAGKYKPFEGDVELVPGIHAVASPGHTPGHTFYVVESKGQKLVVWGDVMHVAAVQFANPSVTIQFDHDSKKASAQRKQAYADAAAKGYYVAIAHVSFPGIGHVIADGKAYRWVPVNYALGK